MKLFGTNKKIVWVAKKSKKVDGNFDYEIYTIDYCNKPLMKSTDYVEITKNLKMGKPTSNSKLFFSKLSKIPRVKLQNTELQRCIKSDKADFVVLPDKISPKHEYISAYEDNDTVYLMQDYTAERLFIRKNLPNITQLKCYLISLTKDLEATIELMKNSNLTFVLDKDVNTIIDNAGPDVTLDDLNSIKEMITGRADSETVGLGLKTLSQFNVSNSPLTVRTFLMLNCDRWPWNEAKFHIDVKNMLTNVGLWGYSRFSFPYDFVNAPSEFKNQIFSDKDKEMAKALIKEKVKQSISTTISGTLKVCEIYDINVKINVE